MVISYEITRSVRFSISYDRSKWGFIVIKMNIIAKRKRIVDTDVVNDVTSTRQSVITRVAMRHLWHDVIHCITVTPYDNQSAEGAGGLGIIRGNKVGETE